MNPDPTHARGHVLVHIAGGTEIENRGAALSLPKKQEGPISISWRKRGASDRTQAVAIGITPWNYQLEGQRSTIGIPTSGMRKIPVFGMSRATLGNLSSLLRYPRPERKTVQRLFSAFCQAGGRGRLGSDASSGWGAPRDLCASILDLPRVAIGV